MPCWCHAFHVSLRTSYALQVYAAHPGRFRLVKPVDSIDPAAADTIADWAATEVTVGIRMMLRDEVSANPAVSALNRVLAAAAQHSLPVNLLCWGRLDQAAQLAARNPNTRLAYEQRVEAFRITDRLSDSGRGRLMGARLQRVYRWSPSRA